MNKAVAELLCSRISEDQLNSYIEDAKDLSLLKGCLEIKANLILATRHSPFYFPIKNIIALILNSNADEISKIIHDALIVHSSPLAIEALLQLVEEHILINIKDESSTICFLKLLDLLLSACNMEQRKTNFVPYIHSGNFDEVLSKLLTSDSRNITNFLMTYILPKYFDLMLVSDSSKIFQVIWKRTLESNELSILCFLDSFLLPIDPMSERGFSSLVHLDEFWFLLQRCLNNEKSVLQKQALYLLKRALHSLDNKESFTTESRVIAWSFDDKTEIFNALQNLMVLFEVAREKQLHLVEPSYSLLAKIKILHSSWLLCVYKILLQHSHSAVSAYAIVDLLKSSWYADTSSFEVIIRVLMQALNQIENIEREEIWRELYGFSKRVGERHFEILLRESSSIAWIPCVCYLFYKNVFFQSNRCVYLPIEIVESLFVNLRKLPHRFIRSGCVNLVRNFVHDVNESISLDDFVIINWIMYKDKYKLTEKNNLSYRFIDDIQKLISTNWIDCDTIELKKATIILNLLMSPVFSNDWLTESVLEAFREQRFPLEVLDKLCINLFRRRLISSSDVYHYIQERLINLECPSCFKEIFLEIDVEQLQLIFNKCTETLLNKQINSEQAQIAFELIIVVLENNTCIITKEYINVIVQFWKECFLNRRNTNLCISFLIVYCDKELYKINNDYVFILDSTKELVEHLKDMLEFEDNTIVVMFFELLKYILNLYEENDVVFDFCDACLTKLIELKGTDTFKSAIEYFIKSIFSNTKISINYKKTLEISWQLMKMAELSEDVAYVLIKHLYHLSLFNITVIRYFIPLIIDLLLFGNILVKGHRADYIVCQQIAEELQTMDEMNPNYRRQCIRSKAALIIEELLNTDRINREDKISIADEITSLLMDKYNAHFNKRYFAHSYIHLQKLRILQALLLAQKYVNLQKQPLTDLLINSLCSESHQMSVKLFIQWLLIRLMHNNDQCLMVIRSKIENTSKIHSSTIIAFVPILYHIAVWRNNEEFCFDLLNVFLPWTMGAHFNLRLYAQEGIIKLYEFAVKNLFVRVQQEFKHAVNAVAVVLDKTERKIDIIDKYVFEWFNPNDHYHLHTIYYDIPKITNVTCDEYENILSMEEFNTSGYKDLTHIRQYYSLTQTKLASLKCKDQSGTTMIQKKINPTLFDVKKRQPGELIVVASLIDKAPNLGGLSRTCEIFGVGQLILNSIGIVKDQEFRGVSMSSENWIDLYEVKVDALKSFILNRKQNGYTVIGGEQTSDSIDLNRFKFPKKSLLLLGNEKEGIPPNLLSLIDFCIEIPQFGMVRSLNVHVAAATIIWEYTKQHVIVSAD